MNIFFLSKDPVEAAQLNCDQHCRKIILETLEMLNYYYIVNYDKTLFWHWQKKTDTKITL